MSKKLNILDCQGNAAGEYALPKNSFELEKGTQAVHETVVAFMAGERAGTACTKTRSERSGGGIKPFRQKGTGRARSGSTRNPIWRKGGIIFGPKPRSFGKKVNKKVRQLALKRVFSEMVNENNVIVIDKFELPDMKTKSAVSVLKSLNADKGKVMMVVNEYQEKELRATLNLADFAMIKQSSVNVYQLLYFDTVIFTKDALESFAARLG